MAAKVPRVREVVRRKARSNLLSQEGPTQLINPRTTGESALNQSLTSRFARLRSMTIDRQQIKEKAAMVARSAAPLALALAVSSVAHAQGSIDMSGATNVINTFKTFALYAGAVICLGSLIFAGIRLMSGRFQEAIPAFFGALFGAGVLGWGAGWISSLTGQTISN